MKFKGGNEALGVDAESRSVVAAMDTGAVVCCVEWDMTGVVSSERSPIVEATEQTQNKSGRRGCWGFPEQDIPKPLHTM